MRTLMLTIAALLIAPVAGARQDAPFLHPADAPPERQFDFWLGQWDVQNRFIAADGSERAVEAEAVIWPAIDGRVIVEHWRSKADAWPMRGFSMRSYDPDTDRWTIALCWPGDGPAKINLMEGRFRNGRAEFFPASTPDGERPRSRFTFSDVGPNSLRWDMAVPVEGDERAWRTTWVMEWTRHAPDDPIDVAALHGEGPSENGELNWILGEWIGAIVNPCVNATAIDDEMTTEPILAGRATLTSIGPIWRSEHHWMFLVVWDRDEQRWRSCGVGPDNQLRRYEGQMRNGALELVSDNDRRRLIASLTRNAGGWTIEGRAEPGDAWECIAIFNGHMLRPLDP